MYPIIQVPENAAESLEQLGTKSKFWFFGENGRETLYKQGRPETGENWAEKIASELAGLLSIPHAHYDFATHNNSQGVICQSLVNKGARLIHGNELLGSITPENNRNFYKQKQHTMSRVLSYFRANKEVVDVPSGFKKSHGTTFAIDVFIGYLLFDVWIANQDRHDQNWGILRDAGGKISLCPSYDHGSSMGRNEKDEKRRVLLNSNDRGQQIAQYVRRARSAFYLDQQSKKSMLTIDAFSFAANSRRAAAKYWMDQICSVSDNQIQNIIQNVPDELMTETAKSFVFELLKLNRQRILKCEIPK